MQAIFGRAIVQEGDCTGHFGRAIVQAILGGRFYRPFWEGDCTDHFGRAILQAILGGRLGKGNFKKNYSLVKSVFFSDPILLICYFSL